MTSSGHTIAQDACRSIQEAVAKHYGLTVLDIKSDRQDGALVIARRVGMYLAREICGLSCGEIADGFNKTMSAVRTAVLTVGSSEMMLASADHIGLVLVGPDLSYLPPSELDISSDRKAA